MPTPDAGPSAPAPARTRAIIAMLALSWLVLVAGGLALVIRYDNTPGAPAAARGRWPGASRLIPDPSGPTLVMVAHPRCACTRASLVELAEVLARAPQPVRAYVVMARPGRLPGDPAATDLWQRAARIPGVTVVRDADGTEAAAFGAETSGQVFLYTASGDLAFAGGATAARGHAGDNAGRASLLAILHRASPPRTQTPVFGCDLFGPGDLRAGPLPDHDTHDR